MAEISLRGIRKEWGSKAGVAGIDLDVRDTEFMVLLGPSGCGKTTTMRIIAGLEEPTAGEVRIGGELMNGVDPRDRDVAMVFQSYALYPNMTVYENIRFPLRVRGVPRADQDRLVRRAAALVEMAGELDRKPGVLSGGQRQRAALARAVVREPQVFLMDEPLSNLDARLRLTMRAELKHIQRQLRTTTVYVTHDQIEAMTLGNRIAVMREGRIQQLGTPDEIYNDPNHLFVAGFIGAPPMNLIAGSLEDGVFRSGDLQVESAGAGSRAQVTLGVRPEDITVVPHLSGDAAGELYSLEPTGDQTLIAARLAGQLIVAKATRTFRQAIGSAISFRFDRDRMVLFDSDTGERIRGDVVMPRTASPVSPHSAGT